MEIDKYRRLTQKDTKMMYDNALEEKQQVKRMEEMLDEVRERRRESLDDFNCYFRKKMKN